VLISSSSTAEFFYDVFRAQDARLENACWRALDSQFGHLLHQSFILDHHDTPIIVPCAPPATTAVTADPQGSIVQEIRFKSRQFRTAICQCLRPSPPSAAEAAANKSTSGALDWDTFFKMRLRRRRIQLFFSVTSGVVGGAAGAVLLSTGLAEQFVTQIPLDPFITLGLMTFACAGLGWLIGPSIGSEFFYLLNRGVREQMKTKESLFFARVKKNRVDPSNSSGLNPGELQSNPLDIDYADAS
jgi:mitochondrial import inner membrane translocase subunit TIM23